MAADPQYLMQQLQTQGFTPEQAAAIVGNIQHESNLDPTAFNRPEGAYGLMQWRGPRYDALRDYAQEQGAPISDVPTQLGFLGQEAFGPEAGNYQRAFGPGGSPGDMARRFSQYVERAAPGTEDQRAQYAEAAYTGYPSTGFVDAPQTGGATNANVFGGPDTDVPAPRVGPPPTAPQNPFAATQPGVFFGKDELAGQPISDFAQPGVSRDPYSTGKAELGDQLIRTLNPLNLIGTALSIPTYIGAGMRNAMRGAMGLPSDLENLRAKGDLYEQALNAYGVPVEGRGYTPREWGQGSSPIGDLLGKLIGAPLSESGREQARLRNLENLYKLTGIRAGIDRSEGASASRDFRDFVAAENLRLGLGRYGMAAEEHGWKTPLGPEAGRYAGLSRGAAATQGILEDRFGRSQSGIQGRFDTGEKAAQGRFDFSQKGIQDRFDITQKATQDRFNANEAAEAVRSVRKHRSQLLAEQHRRDDSFARDPFTDPSDNSDIAAQMRLDDLGVPEGYGLGYTWWYKDKNGKPSLDRADEIYGVTDLPPEKPKGQAGGSLANDPGAAAAVGGMVTGPARNSVAPPARSTNPDRGANLAEGQTVTEGGDTGADLSPAVRAQKAAALAERQANRDAVNGKGKPWDRMSDPEKAHAKLRALNFLYPE